MIGLGALGSGIAFVLNLQIVREAGGSTASTVTYLTPLFAIVVGVAFLGETVAWHEPLDDHHCRRLFRRPATGPGGRVQLPPRLCDLDGSDAVQGLFTEIPDRPPKP